MREDLVTAPQVGALPLHGRAINNPEEDWVEITTVRHCNLAAGEVLTPIDYDCVMSPATSFPLGHAGDNTHALFDGCLHDESTLVSTHDCRGRGVFHFKCSKCGYEGATAHSEAAAFSRFHANVTTKVDIHRTDKENLQ